MCACCRAPGKPRTPSGATRPGGRGCRRRPVAGWSARSGSAPPAGPCRSRRCGCPPPRCRRGVRAALVALLGEDGVADDHATRVLHAAGRSYLDLLRLRAGEPEAAPDAVLLPADAAQVAAVLALCSRAGVAVVPWGGGTSVVGGVRPDRGQHAAVVALDLRRLDRLLSVDEPSRTAVFQAGVRAVDADALLAAAGLWLGHLPQSYERVTLGGCAATRSAGQASTGHGRFDEMVVGLVLQTPAGELRLGRGAPSAAGPSLLGLVVGSEGAYGVVTEVTVRVRPRPALERYEGLSFPGWAQGLAAAARARAGGRRARRGAAVRPGRDEGAAGARRPGRAAGPGRAGAAGGPRARRRVPGGGRAGPAPPRRWRGGGGPRGQVLRGSGALRLGTGVGDAWARGRYAAPSLRDDLLDAGAAGGDPRDRRSVVAARRGPPGRPRRAGGGAARHAADRAVPRQPPLPARRVAVRHGARPAVRRAGRAVAARQGRHLRRDRRERCHDHPPPRGGRRPPRLPARRGRGPGGRGPARRQGGARPRRGPQPRHAAPSRPCPHPRPALP